MKTVIVTWVVKNDREARALMNDISEDIGNNAGFPYVDSEVRKATKAEIAAHAELVDECS